jgi:hypothetical protein
LIAAQGEMAGHLHVNSTILVGYLRSSFFLCVKNERGIVAFSVGPVRSVNRSWSVKPMRENLQSDADRRRAAHTWEVG